MNNKLKITILVDNPKSWIFPYTQTLLSKIKKLGHEVVLEHNMEKIDKGDLAFFLSCEKIIPKSIRNKNINNLVVHESALPQGRGWSPLTWQILEGKNDIPITIFEAEDSVDSGAIYFQEMMHFQGDELVDNLRQVQAEKTIELVMRFVNEYPNINGKKQNGEATFYSRRNPKDSIIDVNLPIKEQFNRLRVADNDRYPAFFEYKGKKYFIRISRYE